MTLNIPELIFYLFALIAVGSGAMVIISNNPVRSALFLVLAFFAAAGLWLMAQAEFLALILILVYVGAVMTLFLFVIMMLNIDVVTQKRRFVRYLPFGLGIVGLLLLLMLVAIRPEQFSFAHLANAMIHSKDFSNTQALGEVLYTQYAFGFEIAAAILLVAMISAISLAHRGPRNAKTQRPNEQVRVKAKDRIRLVEGK